MKNYNRLREKLGFKPMPESVVSDPFASQNRTDVKDLTEVIKISKKPAVESACLEYVQGSNLAPQATQCEEFLRAEGSTSEAKQAACKRFKQQLGAKAHHKDRLKSKLKDKLRSFDRHKKESIQYQSAMDWVIAQKGLLFDVLMFAVSAMLNKSVSGSIPFALSLISHHVPENIMAEAQSYLQDIAINLTLNLQSDDSFEGATGANDTSLNDWFERYRSSQTWIGLKELYVYLTCIILHGPERCRKTDIKKMMKESALELYEDTGNVLFNIIRLTKMLFTNFFQCMRSGKWSDMFHSESVYDKWFADNLEVERKFAENIIPNDAHDLITKTEELLKQGKEMLDQLRRVKDSRKMLLAVNSRYLRTFELFTKFMGAVSATELRRVPFTLLIAGKSKIGKTSFMELNHITYATLHSKDKDVRPYIRQCADRFWDAHKSNQWSIIFDDVSAHNPARVVGVDEFHKDAIHIINNVAKMAECAALEDKGTHPLLIDLAQITTNIPDLHAGIYFYDTAALFRRLQHRVSLVLKPEFRGDDGFLDPSKIPETDAYPDLWQISIERAITKPFGHEEHREQGQWEPIPELQNMDMWQYLQWFRQASFDHVKTQDRFLYSMKALGETHMCSMCGLPLANHPENTSCFNAYFQSDDYEETKEGDDYEPPLLDISNDVVESDFISPPSPLPGPPQNEPKQSWYEWFSGSPRGSYRNDSNSDATLRMVLLILSRLNDYFLLQKTKTAPFVQAIFALLGIYKNMFAGRVLGWITGTFSLVISLPLLMLGMVCFFPTFVAEAVGWNFAPLVENVFTGIQLWVAVKLADQARLISLAGRAVYESLGGEDRILAIIAILSTGIFLLYMLLRSFFPTSTAEQTETNCIRQGQLVTSMKNGREPENVWRMHDYKCNIMDIPNPSSSLKTADEMTIVSYFHRFLVRIKIRWNLPDKAVWRVTGGTGILLGGQKILLLTHFFDKPEGVSGLNSVVVLYSTRQNVTREAVCSVDRYSLEVFDEQMSILTFPAMPAQRAIQTTIPEKEMLNFIGPGLRIGRGKEGEIYVDRIKRIKSAMMPFGQHWQAGDGKDAITKIGDCGALLLALTPSGPVLVGVHLWLQEFSNHHKVSYAYNMCGKKFQSVIADAPPNLINLEKVGELGDLHSKSPIQYLDDLGGMQVFGSFSGFRTSVKSKVVETIGASFLKEKYGFVHTHGAPVMRGREVKYLHLQSFKRTNARVSEYQAELACAVLMQHALEHSDNWSAYMISQQDAVNGVPGVRFIDRIPISTSCGFPYKTPKYNKILPIVDGDWTSELVVDDDIQADIDHVFERWSEYKRASPIFTAALKDEPRKFSKIESKSTRIFYGGPAGLIIAERMIFSWFTRLVQTNPLVFMQAPGMDATGSQWDLLYKWMNKSDNWIAGDFKEFDISMIIQFLRMSYKFIVLLAKHLDADPHHVKMMEVAAEDLINPMVDYFGDLIMGTGKNPSGHALTVIINGLVNAFYMIHCYLVLHPESNMDNRYYTLGLGEGFFHDVRAMFYGDDNIMNVNDGVEWFNHTAISDYMKSVGVTYTMADKDRASTPYVKGEEITFLKRSFRYEPEVGGYVAPLDITSVHKALMLTIPSKVVSKEKAYCDCIVSQNDTMWHHGKEEFERFQIILKDLISHLDLSEYMVRPLLTYDELSARWISTRDSLENYAWEPDSVRYQCQSSNDEESVSCPRCGQCPYEELFELEYAPCRLCGGCTFGGDPWCIVCQEDGFCSCGELFDFQIMVNRCSNRITILLACGECDDFRIKYAPLTRIVARDHGIPWSEVSHT